MSPCDCDAVIGGDGLVMSIAAASIIAKVTRDRLMCALAQDCPGYGFETHKGYAVPEHLEALDRLGPDRASPPLFRAGRGGAGKALARDGRRPIASETPISFATWMRADDCINRLELFSHDLQASADPCAAARALYQTSCGQGARLGHSDVSCVSPP